MPYIQHSKIWIY